MQLNKWQKTKIVWRSNSEWVTNIPVTDLAGCGPHYIRRMEAVSIPNGSDGAEARSAVLIFDVIRGVIGPTNKRKEILNRMKTIGKGEAGFYLHVSAEEIGPQFKMSFNLKGSFCDNVIEFMRRFFKVLGIKDPGNHYLSDFTIESVSMHRQGAGWIPFEDYFKLQHRLDIRELRVEIMPDTKPLPFQ